MRASPHARVVVDLRQVRTNAQDILARTGVPLIAVVKADAYGLGAERVTAALADLAERFCVFRPDEAIRIDLWRRTGKPALAIGPPTTLDPADYLAHHIQPAVSNPQQAEALRNARPVLCVDTGQQRFACPIDNVDETFERSHCEEAYTHATTLGQVQMLRNAMGNQSARLHAAGSSLLNEPTAWLDAVRPGLALYRGAVRVSTRLVETHKSIGPAGYNGFLAPYHGIILTGYSNGLKAGPCLVNGQPSRILEVGMQSAFVEIQSSDRIGDEVVLLGDSLAEQHLATAWNTSPHECLVRLASLGIREYFE
jgi:alanine racemase